jgi:hypothetical protein
VVKPSRLDETFTSLRGLLAAQSARLVVTVDKPGDYQVASPTLKDRIGRPLYIAGVKTGKNYVSYHVMPIYMKPELLKSVPPELQKRMQGKACFNFTTVDREQLKHLATVTKAGIAAFRDIKLPWMDTGKPSTSSGARRRPR